MKRLEDVRMSVRTAFLADFYLQIIGFGEIDTHALFFPVDQSE